MKLYWCYVTFQICNIHIDLPPLEPTSLKTHVSKQKNYLKVYGECRHVEIKAVRNSAWKGQEVSVLVDNNPYDLLTATGSQVSTGQDPKPARRSW